MRIAPVTFARSEVSSLLPVCRRLAADPGVDLRLIVSGAHLSDRHGRTQRAIDEEGIHIAECLPMDLDQDDPASIAASVGGVVKELVACFQRLKPDLLLLVGDRLELLAPALAALPMQIPVAHVSGGDVTEGAIDNQVRHAVTQLSHVHFVAMEEHARRLVTMGEEPWRVHVTGDPALDFIRETPLLSREALESALGIRLQSPVILLTYHPVTLGCSDPGREIREILASLESHPGSLIITAPNQDAGNHQIEAELQQYARTHSNAIYVPSLGQLRYYSLLKQADLMVGNSSGGIWESLSFSLPVVNIGPRQQGRVRGGNVIDTCCNRDDITASVRRALHSSFRQSLQGMVNPYGNGFASEKIISVLKSLPDRQVLLKKLCA